MVLLAAPATAHVNPSVTEAPAGSYLKFELIVPHGCGEDGNTTKVEVEIPDGIYTVTAQVVPGWTITKTTEELPEPVDDGFGGEYTERDAVVAWDGGPLAHDQLEEFGMSVKLPDSPGETILFPVIQTCDNGETAEWIQPTVEGEEEPERPAPAIALTEATGDGHGGGDEEDEATGEAAASEEVTAVSSPSDDDDDGLAIAALVAGLLGAGLGGAAFVRTRKSS